MRPIAWIWIFACLCAPAQNTPRQFRETALSPDGRWLAWTVAPSPRPDSKATESEIWLLDLSKPAAAARRMVNSKSAHAEHSPAFSPDNKQIAFLSDIEKS